METNDYETSMVIEETPLPSSLKHKNVKCILLVGNLGIETNVIL